MILPAIPSRIFLEFPNACQADLRERAGQHLLFPARLAFGYWIGYTTLENPYVEKVNRSAMAVFLYFLFLPLLLPLTAVGAICLNSSTSHKDEYFHLKSLVESPPQMKTVDEVIEKLTPKKETKLHHVYEYHAFHDKLVFYSKKFSDNLENKEKWRAFLKTLERAHFQYPDGRKVKCDPSIALSFLNDEKIPTKVEFVPKEKINALFDKLISIQLASFEIPVLCGTKDYLPEVHQKTLSNQLKTGHLLTLSVDQKIVAMLVYNIGDRKKTGGKKAQILTVCRLPEYAGLQAGKKLIQEVKKECKKQNISRITLNVRVSNPALKLYENESFTVVKNLPKYYPCPLETAYKMRCAP